MSGALDALRTAVAEQLRKAGVNAVTAMEPPRARLGRKYLKSLRRELVRVAGIAEPGAGHALLEKVAGKLGEEELLGLIKLYQGRADKLLAPRAQLSYGEEAAPQEITDGAFLI